MGNTIGKIFKLTTFGESHGKAIGGIIDGCPAGLELDFENIQTKIKDLLLKKESTSIEIINGITNSREEKILKVLQWLSDNGKVKLTENKYSWIA